jgi:hypothetical protein
MRARRERIRENVAAYRKLQKALLNNTDGTIPVSDEKNPLVSFSSVNKFFVWVYLSLACVFFSRVQVF